MQQPWPMHIAIVHERYNGDAYCDPRGALDNGNLAKLPVGQRECLHRQPDGRHLRDRGFQLAGLFGLVEQPIESGLVFFRLFLFLDDNLFCGRRADAFAR